MTNTAAKITRTFLWTNTVKPCHLFPHIKLLIFSKDLKPDRQLTGKLSSFSIMITSDTLSVIVLITMFVIVSCQAILSEDPIRIPRSLFHCQLLHYLQHHHHPHQVDQASLTVTAEPRGLQYHLAWQH